jgi:Tfp pilus assembly protein FimT
MKTVRRSTEFQRGFSLAELLLVVAIVMVLAVVAIPNVITTIANIRMRSSMTSLSGALQNCRTLAVKRNRTMSTHLTLEPHGLIAFVKQAEDTSDLNGTDPQVQLQAPVSQVETPSGPGAPAELDAATLGFTPHDGDASFNSRGLPCAYSGGSCTNKGFLYYFTDTRPVGDNGWAAVSVSPAGRVKKWFWNGSSWVD